MTRMSYITPRGGKEGEVTQRKSQETIGTAEGTYEWIAERHTEVVEWINVAVRRRYRRMRGFESAKSSKQRIHHSAEG